MRPATVIGGLALVGLAFATGWATGRSRSAEGNAARTLGDGDLRRSVKAPAAELETLLGLPYVDATADPEPELSDVLLHDPDQAQEGVNFYHSRTRREAYLVDMEGRLLHRWAHPGESPWHSAELLADGGLLVVEHESGILRLDAASRQVWRYPTRAHHDLWVAGDRVYALSRRSRRIPEVHPEIDLLDDQVVVLSADGDELEVVSIYDTIARSPYRWLLHSLSHRPPEELVQTPTQALDVLHTNHIEVFDGALAGRSPLYERGNILLSVRNLNAVLILDGTTGEILWLWGPTNLLLQHHPSLLDDGHLLVFDNRRKQSRIVELDPVSYRVVWEYTAPDFFSETRGSAQRLANGNTLITESDTGYAFEVTPDGTEVWRFANPDVDEAGMRSTIWRMTRFPPYGQEFPDQD